MKNKFLALSSFLSLTACATFSPSSNVGPTTAQVEACSTLESCSILLQEAESALNQCETKRNSHLIFKLQDCDAESSAVRVAQNKRTFYVDEKEKQEQLELKRLQDLQKQEVLQRQRERELINQQRLEREAQQQAAAEEARKANAEREARSELERNRKVTCEIWMGQNCKHTLVSRTNCSTQTTYAWGRHHSKTECFENYKATCQKMETKPEYCAPESTGTEFFSNAYQLQ